MANLFTEFRVRLNESGLEWFGKFYSFYRAEVADNKDPEFMGRIKVKVPQIYGDKIPNRWCYPRGMVAGKNSGIFWVPAPGDPIYVSFENGDVRFPCWEYGWYTKTNATDLAKTTGPQAYVFQTPNGHRIVLNDAKGQITIENKTGTVIQASATGIFIGNKSGDLASLIDSLMNTLQATTVVTALGPMPFVNLPAYTALQAQFKLLLTPTKNAD